MIKVVTVLGAAAVLVGCSSSGGSSAQDVAKAYTCPSVSRVTAAAGVSLGVVKRSTTGDRTVLCAYGNPESKGSVIVSVTFGAGQADYEEAVKIIGGSSTGVSGVGDDATVVVDQGVRQLIVRSGSRVLTVTTDPGGQETEIKVAKLFT